MPNNTASRKIQLIRPSSPHVPDPVSRESPVLLHRGFDLSGCALWLLRDAQRAERTAKSERLRTNIYRRLPGRGGGGRGTGEGAAALKAPQGGKFRNSVPAGANSPHTPSGSPSGHQRAARTVGDRHRHPNLGSKQSKEHATTVRT